MRSIFRPLVAISVLLLAACATDGLEPAPTRLSGPPALPLVIDGDYQIRKILVSLFDPETTDIPTRNEVILFERSRRIFGAVDSWEISKRFGNNFSIHWRVRKPSPLTVRLEYRQAGLADFVQAQEFHYPEVRGSGTTRFGVVGDEFLENGRVTAWRVLLIVDGRIVGFSQSAMWR